MAEIYALKCPTTGDVRYIGKANDSQKRFRSHMSEKRRKYPVYCWIESLRAVGLSPVLSVLLVTDNWEQEEKRLIAEYRGIGCQLLNVAEGGDEPYCSPKQRGINGAVNANAIHSDAKRKRVWELKKAVGDLLLWFKRNDKKGSYNSFVDKLKLAAMKNPKLFGGYSSLSHI